MPPPPHLARLLLASGSGLRPKSISCPRPFSTARPCCAAPPRFAMSATLTTSAAQQASARVGSQRSQSRPAAMMAAHSGRLVAGEVPGAGSLNPAPRRRSDLPSWHIDHRLSDAARIPLPCSPRAGASGGSGARATACRPGGARRRQGLRGQPRGHRHEVWRGGGPFQRPGHQAAAGGLRGRV